jgi:hypothetical protein
LGGGSERNGGENRDECDCGGGRFVNEVALVLNNMSDKEGGAPGLLRLAFR